MKGSRHALVGPAHLWEMKREFQFRFLLHMGLQPQHFLLDMGCGTLRGGIPLIEYLNERHYYGFEVRHDVLEEGRKELQEAGLEQKKPSLISLDEVSALQLEQTFDVIWAFSVLIHLSDEILNDFLIVVHQHLKDTGCFYANVRIGKATTNPPVTDENTQLPPGKKVRTGSCRVFPVVQRSLEFYSDACRRNGLELVDLGTIASLGFESGFPAHDQYQMIKVSKKTL